MCKERYTNAEKDFKDGKYGKVKEPLEEILSLCVGTGYMGTNSLLLAESYFNLEEWLEASRIWQFCSEFSQFSIYRNCRIPQGRFFFQHGISYCKRRDQHNARYERF